MVRGGIGTAYHHGKMTPLNNPCEDVQAEF